MNAELRHSEVSYVLVCLRIDGAPHFLLAHHTKWGDWSLTGGHVDPSEHGSWASAAAREVQEELPPLQHRKDFLLIPIFSRPVTWGPEESRSSGNQLTIYHAQFFAMELVVDPVQLFAAMNAQDLRLVPQAELERGRVSGPLQILRAKLIGGLTSVPLAWPEGISRARLPQQLFDAIPTD
jgi:ADP-ribose pyrophosphatase YjhB (NUDIX family)